MTSKQRAYLKSKASTMDPIFQIGKSSVTDENMDAISEAIEKRELIKLHVLKNCMDDPNEIARVIAQNINAEVVQVIGKKIVLFKQKRKDSAYHLPR
ncbi:MAG: ribosome assembly RNA-binding protein YhbY [Lachnospiraceae bacterium]|nr:ribosome assembly RNA-binding protein YhbY [Lachnospiraceae bacterium]